MAKKESIKITEKELFNNEKKFFKKLHEKDLLNVSGGVSAKQLMISGSLLSLIIFGATSLNNPTAHADLPEDPPVSQSTTASNSSTEKDYSDSQKKAKPNRKTPKLKIIKPSFKNTARGKLRLQKQKKEAGHISTFLQDLPYPTQGLLDFLMNELEPLNQEAKKRDEEQREAAKKRAEEKREAINQRARERARKFYADLTPEQKEARNQRERERRAALTSEQKDKIRRKYGLNTIKYFQLRNAKKKIRNAMKSMKTTDQTQEPIHQQGSASHQQDFTAPLYSPFYQLDPASQQQDSTAPLYSPFYQLDPASQQQDFTTPVYHPFPPLDPASQQQDFTAPLYSPFPPQNPGDYYFPDEVE